LQHCRGEPHLRVRVEKARKGINWKHLHLIQRSDGYGYAVSASPVNPVNRITLPA
jgi:hypothetical protein